MKGFALAVKAKLGALTDIKSRFLIDHAGVLAMRIALPASAGGDVALVRFDGDWKSVLVSVAETKRFKQWASIEGEVRHVQVSQARLAPEKDAPVGSLVLNGDGLWLVVKYWHEDENVFVSLADGERSWPDQREATIFDEWALQGMVGDAAMFEVGNQGASPLDVSVRMAR